VSKTVRPFRVIELITVVVIASLITAITLPRCSATSTHNQTPPVAQP